MTGNAKNKNRIIVALDVEKDSRALELVDILLPGTPFFKVGMELYYRTGSYLIKKIRDKGGKVFLDLKIHDIPNTAAGAARAAVATGAFMINFHASGGNEMLKAAARAARREAERLEMEPPLLIGVTVLTSLSDEDLEGVGVSASPAAQVLLLAKLCRDAGLDGVVASPLETSSLRQALGTEFVIVTPGVRPAGESLGDQKRVLTPAQAVQAGSDYLVIGRPITGAENPYYALQEIKRQIDG